MRRFVDGRCRQQALALILPGRYDWGRFLWDCGEFDRAAESAGPSGERNVLQDWRTSEPILQRSWICCDAVEYATHAGSWDRFNFVPRFWQYSADPRDASCRWACSGSRQGRPRNSSWSRRALPGTILVLGTATLKRWLRHLWLVLLSVPVLLQSDCPRGCLPAFRACSGR